MGVLNMIYKAGSGHTGGSLSCVDILVSLYFHVLNIDPKKPDWPDRDRFILSKGHSVEGYYQVLAHRGFYPVENLATYHTFASPFTGHPTTKVPGVEFNTGALGHGLPAAVGMAVAGTMDNRNYRTFVLMGDGEQAEGSVWEAAMAASDRKLGNLTAIVDRNKLQISGDTESVMTLEDLEKKWRSFGWKVENVDGHDMERLCMVLGEKSSKDDSPRLVIAHTIKGKGVSFIENNVSWHHRVPTEAELAAALGELQASEEVV